MAQDGNWTDQHDASVPQFVHIAANPPCQLDVQVTLDHELEFHFDATGHVRKVICSCGTQGTVEML